MPYLSDPRNFGFVDRSNVRGPARAFPIVECRF